jgi:hypothetical protein
MTKFYEIEIIGGPNNGLIVQRDATVSDHTSMEGVLAEPFVMQLATMAPPTEEELAFNREHGVCSDGLADSPSAIYVGVFTPDFSVKHQHFIMQSDLVGAEAILRIPGNQSLRVTLFDSESPPTIEL